MAFYKPAGKVVVMAVAVLLLSVVPALAQGAGPFSVLTTNSDLLNHKLYVEIMYTKPSCNDYQAKFRLEDKSGLKLTVAVDSVLNNAGTYTLSSDKMSLMRPQAGGYRLRFDLPKGVKASDSISICVESYELAYRCRGCGSGGSDAIFEPKDVDKGCPYKGDDMIACHKRKGAMNNWEGWILDARDCKPYRVVLMPEGRWWFAQNLDYNKMIVNSGNANIGLSSTATANNNNLWGNYWCTGIPPRGVVNLTATSGQAACATYGALYTWNTVMRRDGFSTVADKEQPSTWFSEVQGICPDGWLLPSDFDWGLMLNATEGCMGSDMIQTDGTAPCNHLMTKVSETPGKESGEKAFAYLKSTLSCPPHLNVEDSICATTEKGAWIWHRLQQDGKLITPRNLGEDLFGFSLLPGGHRVGNSANTNASFTGVGMHAGFWTSSEYNNNNAYYRYWDAKSDQSGSYVAYTNKFQGKSVRCLKNSTGGVEPHIIRLHDVSGKNTDAVTFTAYASFGATVDWYDSPDDGELLLAGSTTYTTTSPMRVYAQARNVSDGTLSKTFYTARASFTYSYTGSYHTTSLIPGVYIFTCYGAKGGNGSVEGGKGGMVEGTYSVLRKVNAYVYVGGSGQIFNGAGTGGRAGSGSKGGAAAGGTGGGASDVRVGGTGLSRRVIVAGGGGGGGGRGSDFYTAGTGGDQNMNGKDGVGLSTSNASSSVWPQGGGGGGGGGYRNGDGGKGATKLGRGGCRPGEGGAAGGAGAAAGNGTNGGYPSYFGCAGGGGGGGTHYIGGVIGGTVKDNVNTGNGYVIIQPQ